MKPGAENKTHDFTTVRVMLQPFNHGFRQGHRDSAPHTPQCFLPAEKSVRQRWTPVPDRRDGAPKTRAGKYDMDTTAGVEGWWWGGEGVR